MRVPTTYNIGEQGKQTFVPPEYFYFYFIVLLFFINIFDYDDVYYINFYSLTF